MSAIRLRGATSGTTDVVAAAIAGDGVLTLPSGTGTLATAAYVDAAVAAGGKVLQVVSVTSTTAVSTNSTSFVTTGLTATITPSSVDSKILIMCTIPNRLTNTTTHANMTLFRGTVAGTNLGNGNNGLGMVYSGASLLTTNFSMVHLDSPATVSSQQYTAGLLASASGQTITAQYGSTQSNIILMEISA